MAYTQFSEPPDPFETQPAGKRSKRSPLSRPAYAKRVGACLLGLVGFGFVLGFSIKARTGVDPTTALTSLMAVTFVANAVAGSFFVSFTYRRALDCRWGQNGMAWIAAVVALPTLALPQYGLLVFVAMMFFKSAEDATTADDYDEIHQPLHPAE